MKSTGLVFSSRAYIGSVEPPALGFEDKSRFGNDGIIASDGHPDWVRRPSGLWELSFDGVNDYITFAPPIVLADDTLWTIDFWLRTTDAGYINVGVTGNLNTAGNYEKMFIYHNARFYVQDKSNNSTYFSCVISETEMHHLALVCLGDVAWNLLFYLDGVYVGVEGLADSQQTIRVIGNIGDGTIDYKGYIAPLIRIRNWALSAGKIKQIFESGRHWFGV